MSRRHEFAVLVPLIINAASSPINLSTIYATVERDRPDLVDEEIEPGPGKVFRWKHELRWEIETLVGDRRIRRRKDLGRGVYSA